MGKLKLKFSESCVQVLRFLRLVFSFAIATCLATLLLTVTPAFANSGITYHGRILRSDGTALTGNNVRFKIQIRTPGVENCLLYEEIQTRNMANSGGAFALTINDRTGLLNFSAAPFAELFSNRKTVNLTSPSCTYSPSPSDTRKLIVYFKDETMQNWESMGVQNINPAPVALQAQQVDGFPASSLLRVEDSGVTIETQPLTQNQYDDLVRLVLGTSTVYSLRTQLAGANLPTVSSLTAGQSIRWNGTQWEAFTPSGGTGTVTSVTAGTGLATTPAGGIPTTGSIGIANGGVGTNQLADDAVTTAKILDAQVTSAKLADGSVTGAKLEDVATAGTYNSVTVDSKGRVTSGSNAAAVSSGTIGGSTVINTAGAITTSGNLSVDGTSTLTGNVSAGGNISVTGDVSAANITSTNLTATNVTATGLSTRLVRVYDSDSSNYVDVVTPATGVLTSNYSFVLPNYNLSWPATSGSTGQILTTDGSGNLSWTNPGGSGTVTSVTAGSGLETSPAGGITGTGSIAISSGGVTSTHLADGSITTAKLADGGTTTAKLADGSVTGTKLETLATVTAGTYGSASSVPVVTVDNKGRITAVSNTSISVLPSGTSGQFLKSDGTSWSGAAITLGDMRSTVGGNLFSAPNCTSSQTLSWSAATDQFSCISIGSLDAAVISSGTLDTARLPTTSTAKGGTGLTSIGTANQILGVNTGGTALEYKSRGILESCG